MTKRISILGATGSIGLSTLDVVRAMPERFAVTALSAGSRWKELAALAKEFNPGVIAIADESLLPSLRDAMNGYAGRIVGGVEGVIEAAAASGAEMLVSAAVGAAGLRPTLAAIHAGLDIALANKETLVMAGAIVTELIAEKKVAMLPVDSEHSALHQCIQCGRLDEVRRLVLTASGGPFRGRSAADLATVTAADALAHPTWDMGAKITIDSATLVNKALEVIEAHWLFGLPYDAIDVVVHPQSVVHSMVEYADGSTIAQLGPPDMRIPIQYALTWPERAPTAVEHLDLAGVGSLTFEEPDRAAFPCLDLGIAAGEQGGLGPAVYSAANEAAVALFLEGAISFPQIAEFIGVAIERHTPNATPDLDAILAADADARRIVYEAAEA